MSNYYGINRSDEYLQHWGIQKGGQRKNHKYLMRVKSGSGWRYLYTPAEVAAYGKERVSGALSKAGRMAKSLGKRIGSQATYGVQRVTSLFKDPSTNSRRQKGSLEGRDATDAIQTRLKKQMPDRTYSTAPVTRNARSAAGGPQISNGSKRDPGRRTRNQTPKQSKANANSESTRSFSGSLKTGKPGIPSKSNGASGAGNNRRSIKKTVYKRTEGNYSTQTNATHTKVKVAKKPLSKVPVLGRVPLLKDISFGKETVDKYLLGNRQTSNKTTKRKASKKARYYK